MLSNQQYDGRSSVLNQREIYIFIIDVNIICRRSDTKASIVNMKKLNGLGLDSCSSQGGETAGQIRKSKMLRRSLEVFIDCEETPGLCSMLLTLGSVLIVLATLPFSLLYTIKVVQV